MKRLKRKIRDAQPNIAAEGKIMNRLAVIYGAEYFIIFSLREMY